MKALLVTPPFTQLNTPYPATPYLGGFLKSQGIDAYQLDMGIEIINILFSSDGLKQVFNQCSDASMKVIKQRYIETIDPVMDFLRGKDTSLAHRICFHNYLPEGNRFDHADRESFGSMGLQDQARHLCTLYLNDISDYITAEVDPDFGFSRYRERIAVAASSFTPVYEGIKEKETLITSMIRSFWNQKLDEIRPDLVSLTIPFPGNLSGALILAQEAQKRGIPTAAGGGYVNTELRRISDTRFFTWINYLLLDDGERPLLNLIHYLQGRMKKEDLKRTFLLENGSVTWYDSDQFSDFSLKELPAPDYTGLSRGLYFSVLDMVNPMHSLWSSGQWNKLTLAHGCYWKKCAFCDTSLDYICRMDNTPADIFADKIENLISQTGYRGFHFVDEAAPPALLKKVALEILKRGLTITWWTNIRFEKNFTPALCRLLARSGCIGVSGGIETASDRLLKRIHKGVTVEQVTKVTSALAGAGIMVHAYLMYGFPGQTEQETIDSLEIVRQLFENRLVQSAYWHQFSLTAHSPVGKKSKEYGVTITGPEFQGFGENDLEYTEKRNYDPGNYSQGLKSSLYYYMRGENFDIPLRKWFSFKTPSTTVKKNYIKSLNDSEQLELKDSTEVIWLGELISLEGKIYVSDNTSREELILMAEEASFVRELTKAASPENGSTPCLADLDTLGEKWGIDVDEWIASETAALLSEYGLLFL